MVYTGPVTHDDEGFSYVVETDIRDETAEGGWVREGIFYRFTLPFWFMITEAGFRPTEKVFHGDEEQPDEGRLRTLTTGSTSFSSPWHKRGRGGTRG